MEVTTNPRINRVPEPDYANHPAYGALFGKPTVAETLRAVGHVAPWIGLVIAKRLLKFDRLPVQSDYDGPMSGSIGRRIAVLPRYARAVTSGLAAHRAGRTDAAESSRPSPRLEALRRDGAVGVRFRPDEMDFIRREMAGPLAALDQKRQSSAVRSFEGNQTWFNRKDSPALYALLEQVLASHDVLADGAAYFRRPLTISYVTLQVNDAADSFYRHKFADAGVADPATNYMHIDTTEEILKLMIYLNEVTEKNGPFSYVLGTASLKLGWFEGVVRRAVDRSGLSGYSAPTRRMFMALPKPLRRKCTFGSDLLDGSDSVKALIAAEHRFTSRDGDAILFDNLGIHRGALVHEGRRQILVVTLA